MKEFIRACSLKDISRRQGRLIVLDDGTQVAIFMVDGELYAVDNVCPHQHAPVIADGFVEDCTVTCPLHGWTFDLKTGNVLGGASRLRTYEVYCDGDEVMLEKPEPELPTWMM